MSFPTKITSQRSRLTLRSIRASNKAGEVLFLVSVKTCLARLNKRSQVTEVPGRISRFMYASFSNTAFLLRRFAAPGRLHEYISVSLYLMLCMHAPSKHYRNVVCIRSTTALRTHYPLYSITSTHNPRRKIPGGYPNTGIPLPS